MIRPPSRQGSTLLMTMIFLSVFAALAVAFTAATNVNLQQATRHTDAQKARLAAESGLAHVVAALDGLEVDPAGGDDGMLLDAANRLADLMDGTANLGGGTVTFDGYVARTPSIPFADGQSYRVELEVTEAGKLDLVVRGSCNGVTRGVLLKLGRPDRLTAFDFGVASRSKIVMTGNASVRGANDPAEANVLSATYSELEAVKLTGNCDIDGDVSTSNPASYVTTTGNISIGGASSWSGDIDQHIHIGVGDVEFPEVDPTVFEPFATNIVDSSTQLNGNKTFENIRVRAGTNPTFSGNVTIRGVVYIEQPNEVKFTGNLDFTGVIVTEDAGENAYDDNTIQFTGNMSSAGVEALPDTPEFAALRRMPGSMLLAPGFGVKFTGNFKTLNGTIAADKFIFTGNAGGTVAGSVICYSDSDFTLTGNSRLTIDRDYYSDDPPGFARDLLLIPDPTSYREL